MIKRIIFDFDNTLIPWREEYSSTYKYALDELNIKYNDTDLKRFEDIANNYEKYYDIFDKNIMINLINEQCQMKVPENTIDVWMKYLSKCYNEEDKNIIPLLEYLSSKYELVILSNWFRYSQVERLKGLKIDKYFKDMIYADEVKCKPHKEAFLKAIGNHKIEECLMVGDSMKVDIGGARQIGMDAILVDPKNNSKYKRKIKDINELKNIL